MKKYYYIYIAVVFGILALFGICSVLLPQKNYSNNENRYLENYPEVSFANVLSGEFQEKFEMAFSDQFIGRDNWMKYSTSIVKLIGYREISGVYIGKDGYYITKTTQDMIDQKQYVKNLHYVEYLGTQMEGKVSLLLAPSSGTILQDKLPDQAPYYDAASMYRMADTILKSSKNIDVCSMLNEYVNQGQVYFKTDHHWTLLGAYAAYLTYCDVNGFDAQSYEYFEPKKISEKFWGTTYSKVLDTDATPDTIYAAFHIPQAEVVSDGQSGQGIYDVKKLEQKDKYGYFFGGNYGEVKIKMNHGDKKLLVIKDSYANSFVPFLMENYGEITMIDLRYYKNSVEELVEEGYDQALVLYEMSNFAQDTNLYKLVH